MPIVDGLEEAFADKVQVIKLNAIEPEIDRLQAEWGLRGHPTFAVLDEQGNVTARFTGPQPAATLRSALAGVVP